MSIHIIWKWLRRIVRLQKRSIGRLVKDSALMILGVLSASIGLKSFLLPNNFLDGGITGISLLIHQLTHLNLAVLLLILNIPFIILGYKQISKLFAFKTLLAILGLVACLLFIPYPVLTSDKFLIAMFGGFFLGCGIGFAMQGGCVLDGTEILSLVIIRKSFLTVGKVIWGINIIIFFCAAILINVETALYAILTFLTASKTIDFIIHGIEEYIGLMIISEKSERIRKTLTEKLGKPLTIYKGNKGLNKEEIDIIYTVVTRLEIQRILTEINRIDPQVCVIQQSIYDIKGGVIKKRPLH